MVDFVKYQLVNINPWELERNPHLKFYIEVNNETGELGKYMNAYYRGLEFRIYEPTEANPERRITMEGSLHKYWNRGAHNFNDFGITQIHEVFQDLKTKFNIEPVNCIIKQVELGVNIIPPYPTETLLNYCLLHKTGRFKWVYIKDEGSYIQVKYQRHLIKAYDKRKHYVSKGFPINNEIMRFEKKYVKLKALYDKGIYNMADLLTYGLENFIPDLLNEWNNVLFYDFNALDGTKYENIYSNPNYWLKLNYEQLKYHRNNLNEITAAHPQNIKKQIANLIKEKAEFLTAKTTGINPLYIGVISVNPTPVKTDKNRRFCAVTGLNISMQRDGSNLLSHTGLRYYFDTDKKIYKEIEKKYLSGVWQNADYETRIKETAHNIRNAHNNQRIK